jgi:MmeI, N-terminal domain
MPDDVKNALREFLLFAQTLRGDEKSESQTFLDNFFRALGHKGVIEAGATFEFRVAKKPGSPQLELIKGSGARTKGGKKFADLLWPDGVLIEMKSRGEKLEKHYDQTFEYWTHIVPHRPPFVILCNFDEFWIYDFSTQLFDPVDRLALRELPENTASFNFLLPIWKKPIFGNNRVEVKPGHNPLRDAHARLDAAVRAAYGMPADADPLAFLLELNLTCAAKEKAGEKITPPGLPLPPNEHSKFVTNDCIKLPRA